MFDYVNEIGLYVMKQKKLYSMESLSANTVKIDFIRNISISYKIPLFIKVDIQTFQRLFHGECFKQHIVSKNCP